VHIIVAYPSVTKGSVRRHVHGSKRHRGFSALFLFLNSQGCPTGIVDDLSVQRHLQIVWPPSRGPNDSPSACCVSQSRENRSAHGHVAQELSSSAITCSRLGSSRYIDFALRTHGPIAMHVPMFGPPLRKSPSGTACIPRRDLCERSAAANTANAFFMD